MSFWQTRGVSEDLNSWNHFLTQSPCICLTILALQTENFRIFSSSHNTDVLWIWRFSQWIQTETSYVAIVNIFVAEYTASIFVIVLSFMKLLPDNLKTSTSLLSKSTDPPYSSAPIPTSSKYSHKFVSARINHTGMRTDKIVHIFLTTCTSSLKRFNSSSRDWILRSPRRWIEIHWWGKHRLWNVINLIFWRCVGRPAVFKIPKRSAADLDEKINLIKAPVGFLIPPKLI